MPLTPGQSIDRYTVERFLGRGGMAEVYKVRHATLGSLHALKVLTDLTGRIRERLIQEGQLQNRLQHPNVVRVTDVFEVGGSTGLLMEYVEGPSLAGWLADNHPDFDEAERVFQGVLAGVERAHELGIVHRDLKPGNIMMSVQRGRWQPKVADFGLAKALERDDAPEHTRSGMLLGTPGYMSPEQIRDSKTVDHRSDIFSLGCVLYVLVCRRRPFHGTDTLEVFNAVANGRFIPPRQLNPEIPERMERAIAGCLLADRDARIPDCATLRQVLDARPSWSPAVEAGALPPTADMDRTLSAMEGEAIPQLAADPGPPPRLPPVGGEEPETPPPPGADSRSSMLREDLPRSMEGTGRGEEPAPAGRPWRRRILLGGLLAAALILWLRYGGLSGDIPGDRSPAMDLADVLDGQPLVQETEPPAAEPDPPEPDQVKRKPAEAKSAPSTTTAKPSPTEPAAPATTSQEPEAEDQAVEPPPDPDPTEASDEEEPVPAAEEDPLEEADEASLEQEEEAATEPPAPEPATIRILGDADSVYLQSDQGRFSPASVPPGTYLVYAAFGGNEAVPAGRINVTSGASLTLRCGAHFTRCTQE